MTKVPTATIVPAVGTPLPGALCAGCGTCTCDGSAERCAWNRLGNAAVAAFLSGFGFAG